MNPKTKAIGNQTQLVNEKSEKRMNQKPKTKKLISGLNCPVNLQRGKNAKDCLEVEKMKQNRVKDKKRSIS